MNKEDKNNYLKGKMLEIVENHSIEIYKTPSKFKALIGDYIPNDIRARLLEKIVIDGSVEIYNLKDLKGTQLQAQYNRVLDIIETKTFIDKDKLINPVNLLLYGLSVDYSQLSYNSQPQPPQQQATQPSPPQATQPQKTPATTIAPITINELLAINTPTALSDFKISNGVLIKYIGLGGIVIIPDVVTAIGQSAFDNCTTITAVKIPNTVTSIGGRAFKGCARLTTVAIADTVNSIAAWAFRNCTSLTEINIPTALTSIWDGTFYNCIRFSPTTVQTINSINENAFKQ